MGLAGLTPDPAGPEMSQKLKKNPLKAAMSPQQQEQPLKASLTRSGEHQGALAGTASLNAVAGRPGTPPTLLSPPQGSNADPLVLPDEHFTAITRGPSSPSLQAFFNRPHSLFYLFIYLFFSRFVPARLFSLSITRVSLLRWSRLFAAEQRSVASRSQLLGALACDLSPVS